MLLDLAFPDLVAAKGVEGVFVPAAEGDAVRSGMVRMPWVGRRCR